MAIENFDHGQNKAAGNAAIDFAGGVGALSAIGIRSAVQTDTGEARLELVEAVGESEFFGLALRSDGVVGSVNLIWVDNTHFDIAIQDAAGADDDGAAWFVVYKIAGNFGGVPMLGGGVP
jgi:hypothetical protein